MARCASDVGRRARPSLFLAALVLAALLAPLFVRRTPSMRSTSRTAAQRRRWSHWFGTDELGRDLLTRVLFGARVSLAIGLAVRRGERRDRRGVGATAGYAGRWIDDLLMRVTDAMLSVPRLPLLMIAAAILQPSVPLLIVLVGAAGWMETARVVRAEVQSIKARDFVTAARALGARPGAIVWRHVLPGVVPAVAVATTLAVGRGILLESALSFFGVGVQPPTASWGNMLYQAQTTMTSEPWLGLFPGVFIFLTVLACNAVASK